MEPQNQRFKPNETFNLQFLILHEVDELSVTANLRFSSQVKNLLMTSEEEEEGLMASCHILLQRVYEIGLNVDQ